MKSILVMIAVIVALLIGGCMKSSLVLYETLSPLKKGMFQSQVSSHLALKPMGSLTVSDKGVQYDINYYPMKTGVTASSTMSGPSFRGPITSSYAPSSSVIYFVFRGTKLRYWGLLGDFHKSEDADMADLAPKIEEALSARK